MSGVTASGSTPPEPVVEPSDPVRRRPPDLDPGLAPDPEHEVTEPPPEGDGPASDG